MHMRRSASVTLAGVLLAAGFACSSYTYIPPKVVESVGERSDLVPYRALTRADFQAEKPSQSNKNLDAVTVVTYRADTTLVYAIERPTNPENARWEVSLDTVRFLTLMNPKASWWNPKRTSQDDARRILEHEQLHFDVAELVVRRANARLKQLRATAPTQEGALQEAQQLFDREAERLNKMLMEWSAKYDLETKNGSDRGEQKRWGERVRKELAETDST